MTWRTKVWFPLAMASGALGAVYTLSPVENGMQLKTPDGRVVFEYLTKKPANSGMTSPSAACFHPVNTPSGERITALAPNDHPHHRGIFFGWQDSEFREPASFANYGEHPPLRGMNIRRADFWGWGEYAPREGRVIQTKDVKLIRADSASAQIEIHNDWTIGNRKMLDESDTATVGERDGVYVLDLEYRITPVVDYFLDRSAFGGFTLQCRKDGESYYTNAAGKVNLPDPHYSYPELNWPPAPWYGYVIKLASGKTLGSAVIDHPRNPPTTWHNSSHLWMLSPSITGGGSMTLKGGETLTLRYRVVIHDGETPAALIEKLSAEYRGR
jgi:Methane oxygenase PmoA